MSSRTSQYRPTVAVVGCGMFGSVLGLRLADAGAVSHIYERKQTALLGTSSNNANRLHLGFHYPRDDETARQCIKGFYEFREEFKESVLEKFPNAYFIAKEESFTTADAYLSFCKRLGLQHEVIEPNSIGLQIEKVALGVMTQEATYDSNILRRIILNRLQDSGAATYFNSEVSEIRRKHSKYELKVNKEWLGPYDAIVNCSYANVNLFSGNLGYDTPDYQYEYTMMPIIKWDHKPVGITIMDGPFVSILPHGVSGDFLLYHVELSVIEKRICRQLPKGWLDPVTSPSKHVDKDELFDLIHKECIKFVPQLESAKLTGFLECPRMVLANRESTDSRPSIAREVLPGFWTVFSGKIDHCTWVASHISESILRASQ